MKSSELKLKKLPNEPGVYLFKKGREVLYIGKATSLRDRTLSYFNKDLIKTRGPAIVDMVTQSTSVTYKQTDSVLEALVLESELIKKHQPKYNIKEKDDKSYNYVVITKEKYPRVLLVRGHDLKTKKFDIPIKKQFGPFPNASQLRDAVKLIQRIFPFFDTNRPVDKLSAVDRKRFNLNTQIGIYPDMEDENFNEHYKKSIHHISLFFQGKKKTILKDLEKLMKEESKDQNFERANEIKKTIFALQHINDVSLISTQSENIELNKLGRVESYDIAHTAGVETVGAMVVFENGGFNRREYKKFIIKSASKNDDYGALLEVLTRRFKHTDWIFPNVIVVDGGVGQLNTVKKFLKQNGLDKIKLVSVVKDDKHNARDVLGDSYVIRKYKDEIIKINNETHRFAISFHRKRRDMIK